MKILLDSCASTTVRDALVEAGHEVEWCGDWLSDPGDEQILERARRDDRVVVTLDKDFGEIAVVGNREHSGIVRLVAMAIAEQAAKCRTSSSRGVSRE